MPSRHNYSILESFIDAIPIAFNIAIFIYFPFSRIPLVMFHSTIWLIHLLRKYPWLMVIAPIGLAIIYNQKLIMDKQTQIYMRQNLFINNHEMCPLQ